MNEKKRTRKRFLKKKPEGERKEKKRFVFVSEMDWLIFADLVRGSWDDCIPHDWDRLRKEKKEKATAKTYKKKWRKSQKKKIIK